jgi:membrane fusion protein (multidrug efflux system)
MKRHTIVVFVLWLFIGTAVLGNLFSQTGQKGGFDAYIDYLKTNRAALNYNTYGVIESENEMVVKIYCPKTSQELLINELIGFDAANYKVDQFSEDQIIITVVFLKPAAEAPVARAEEPSTEAAADKVEEETAPVMAETAEDIKCPGRVKVQVRAVTPQTFEEYKYYRLKLDYDAEAVLKSELTGSVKEVLATAGERVTEGQLIVRLDSTVLENEIKSIETLIANWKEILRKRQNWRERSPRAENQAEDKIRESEDLLAQRLTDLSKMQFKAPFSGQILSVASEGDSLQAGQTAVRLVSDQQLKVVLPAEDSDLFGDGQAVRIKVLSPEEEISGTVKKTAAEAKIVVPNEDVRYPVGTEVSFRVLVKRHSQAVVLPESDVLIEQGLAFVYVVDGKNAAKRRVEAGPTEAGNTLILSGLKPGEEVIATNLHCLEDGKKIKIMVWSEAKGKLVPRKKVKGEPPVVVPVAVEEEEREPKPIKPRKKSFFRLGAGAGLQLNTDSVFSDVYGTIGFAGYVSFSYTFRGAVEIFLRGAFVPASGTFTDSDQEVSLTMFPVYLGVKVLLKKINNKFQPFIGAAVIRNNAKETFSNTDLHEDTPLYSDFGASILGGVYYPLGEKLDLSATLAYDITSIQPDDIEERVGLGGLRLLIGISLVLGK